MVEPIKTYQITVFVEINGVLKSITSPAFTYERAKEELEKAHNSMIAVGDVDVESILGGELQAKVDPNDTINYDWGIRLK